MNKIKTTLLALIATVCGIAVLQAQSYYDSVDFLQYSPSAIGNLFQTNGGPMLAVTGDGTTDWRYRNTGPGVPAFNGNSYQIRYSEGDIPGYQEITGLTPNEQYQVMVYGVYPNNTTNAPLPGSRYGAEFSYDNVNWNIIDNRGGAAINWVDNSSGLGASLPTVGASDTRFWSMLPSVATADGSGNLDIYIQLPDLLSDGSIPDRFILDGFALQMAPVPEPTTLALGGLGAAMLMFVSKRRR